MELINLNTKFYTKMTSPTPTDKQAIYERNKILNMKKGWLAVIGCLLVDISVGEFNLLSHLYGYFASWFKLHDLDIKHEDMRYIPMVWLITQSIVSPIGIAMFKYLGYRGSFTLFLVTFGLG